MVAALLRSCVKSKTSTTSTPTVIKSSARVKPASPPRRGDCRGRRVARAGLSVAVDTTACTVVPILLPRLFGGGAEWDTRGRVCSPEISSRRLVVASSVIDSVSVERGKHFHRAGGRSCRGIDWRWPGDFEIRTVAISASPRKRDTHAIPRIRT